jgi:catalase
LTVDKTLLTSGSVLYDAVFVPGGKESAAALAGDGDAVHFVDEAFKHCKAIAAIGEGVDVLLASRIAPPSTNGKSPDQKLEALGSVIAERNANGLDAIAKRFIDAVAKHRDWSRQAGQGAAAGMVPVPA